MNLTSSQGSAHTFDGYNSKFPTTTEKGCIYWDFWHDWPYQASISLEGRDGSDNRVFDSHAGILPIAIYEARIRICRTTADAQTRDFPDHDCSASSGYLEVDLVNDSAGPSGL